jgi:mannosyltransferase
MPSTAIGPRANADSRPQLASEPLRRAEILWLLLLTAAAAGLRILGLTARGLSMDEGFSTFLARSSAASFRTMVWRSEFNMVLYYGLLRLWMHLGHSEFVIRLLSVLFSAATVPVIYFLGLRLFGRKAALVATVLLVVHPSHLLLAQEARSYSLVMLLISLSSLFFLRLLESPSWRNCAAYAVLSAAAVYSHFFAALVMAAQWLALLAFPKGSLPRKALLECIALLVVLLAPVGVFLLHSSQSHVAWVPNTGLSQVLDVLYFWTLSKARCLVYVALWMVAIWCAIQMPRKPEAWPYWFALAWLLVPFAIVAAVSLSRPLLVPRFLAIGIPAAILLAAAGLIQVARWSKSAALIVLLLIVFYSGSAIRFYHRHPESSVDWRGAFAYLLPRVQPGDEVVMDPYVVYTFDYYRETSRQGVQPLVVVGSLSTPLPATLPQNVWVVAPVLINPYEKLPKADTQAQVDAFLAEHEQLYCELPPRPEGASVKVWQMRRCDRE